MATGYRAAPAVDLDRRSASSLSNQLVTGLRELIVDGSLPAGHVLPASRTWASQLGVSRGTVVQALEQLVGEGYLVSRMGSGTVVNPALDEVHPHRARPARAKSTKPSPSPPRYDLRPGQVDLSTVSSAAFRAGFRRAAGSTAALAMDPAGLPALRAELADHLRHLRGVPVTADELVVTGGARDGLVTLLGALIDERGRSLTVAVESPGYPSLREVPELLRCTIFGVPVDDEGISVADLGRRTPPDVVVVTPSHQYPWGASMSAPRRRELLDWARMAGSLVVEDDYDSELRFVGSPLPALAASDRARTGSSEQVATLGSLSKVLSPEVATGFVLAPDPLRHRMIERHRALGAPVPPLVQRALADYLATGALRRHVEQMRRRYRRKRAIALQQLAGLDQTTVHAPHGGLHVVVEFTGRAGRRQESTAYQRLSGQEVAVGRLSTYWSAAGDSAVRYGLAVGFGAPTEAALRTGLELVRSAVAGR